MVVIAHYNPKGFPCVKGSKKAKKKYLSKGILS